MDYFYGAFLDLNRYNQINIKASGEDLKRLSFFQPRGKIKSYVLK